MATNKFVLNFIVILLAAILTSPAIAEVSQSVAHFFNDTSGMRVEDDKGEIEAPTSTGITMDVSAAIGSSSDPYEASGAVGRFGQLGVEGTQRGAGLCQGLVLRA